MKNTKTTTHNRSFVLYFFLYTALILALFMTGSCGNQIKDVSSKNNALSTSQSEEVFYNTQQLPSDSVTTPYDNARECRLPVEYTNQEGHKGALSLMVFKPVAKLEPPTTMCIDIPSPTLKNFDGTISFEYEDDRGIRKLFTFDQSKLIYSSFENNSVHLLFLDDAGYLQVKGSRDSNGRYVAIIKGANLPDHDAYIDQLNNFYRDLHNFCSSSPARCQDIVYLPPSTDYVIPSRTSLVEKAEQYLAGYWGATAYVLGRVRFTLNDI